MLAGNSGCTELKSLYHKAWNSVVDDSQVMKDVNRARNLNPASISSSDFIREYAWTVFNSGMKMRVIRKKWPAIEKAFEYWDCQAIVQNESNVREESLRVFNHYKKVEAIIRTAQIVLEKGWATVKTGIFSSIIRAENGNLYPSKQFLLYIRKLPWMGTTNSRFLAKNCGFDLAKDDRRLRRLAEQYGYSADGDGVQSFIERVSKCVRERIFVVETVLWNACENGTI